MPMSAVELEDFRKKWSTDIVRQINTFGQGDVDSLRLNIEAEKVSILYEIAIQLALSNSRVK